MKGIHMVYIATFQIGKIDRIVIESFRKISDSRDGIAPEVREISDSKVLDQVRKLMNALPDLGDEMIKMGDVPLINVKVVAGKGETYFSLYNGKVKLPDTAFCSDPPEAEAQLHALLMQALRNK